MPELPQLAPSDYNLEGVIHPFPAEKHSLGFGGADSHPRYSTFSCKLPQCMLKITRLMKPTEHRHLQKAETLFRGSQPKHSPHLRCEPIREYHNRITTH